MNIDLIDELITEMEEKKKFRNSILNFSFSIMYKS